MAEQSPQKKGKSKSDVVGNEDLRSPRPQRSEGPSHQVPEGLSIEAKQAGNADLLVAKRKRRHIRARLKKKERSKSEAENADLRSIKKISKEQPKLQPEPQPKPKLESKHEPEAKIPTPDAILEEIYPSVQHHTFIEPTPKEPAKTEELKKPVGNEDLRSPEEPKTEPEPQPEVKTEPTATESSLHETQPLVVQSEPESVALEPQATPVGNENPPPIYEEKEPFPELFPPNEVPNKDAVGNENLRPMEDIRPMEENAAPEIIEQEELDSESSPSRPDSNQEPIFQQEAGANAWTQNVETHHGNASLHLRLKYVILTAVVVFAGFLFASGIAVNIFRSVYGQITAIFQPKAPPSIEVRVEEQLLRAWGVNTAYLFAKNRGSLHDIVTPSIKNAFYFGKLADPAVKGETGITAAYHYGQYKDALAKATLFIDYINNLRELKSLYDTDVYGMLNQTSRRDAKLADYLAKLKNIRINSARIIKELGLQTDDLKISFNSLSPDRKNLEEDFFSSLEKLAGEKANFLLQSFVDVAQKQTALKARLSALQQILDLYEKSVKKLDIRIEAIEKNYEALLRGIRVVDIPGANLDIIIRPRQ